MTIIRLRAAVSAASAIGILASATTLSAQQTGEVEPTEPLLCMIASIAVDEGTTQQSMVRVPQSKVERFTALGFQPASCPYNEQSVATAGVTLCDLAKRPEERSASNLSPAPGVDVTPSCTNALSD